VHHAAHIIVIYHTSDSCRLRWLASYDAVSMIDVALMNGDMRGRRGPILEVGTDASWQCHVIHHG
jgi:hypothetical protein